ncbi:MAG: hypothetical protein JOZ16_08885, partial [Methylobacteriaceae bacterium]|nr:hypothetical protein [Methylobacteriaceae bacterium]
MQLRIGQVTFEDRLEEYEIVAENNIQAREILITYLGPSSGFKSIRVRDTPQTGDGPARAVLRSIIRIDRQDFVFTTTGKSPISGFSRARRLLDAKITEARDGALLSPWRLHDFRRSGVTRLAGM